MYMILPSSISINSELILGELAFDLTYSEDNGMIKNYEWKNKNMKLLLRYERGYYECFIVSYEKPIESLALIKLLRFIKNDSNFYKKELVETNLYYTLSINEYITLLNTSYCIIKDFLLTYNDKVYDNFKNYKDDYTGLSN